jgi:glycosyltransferase involved in cell wall biosynthesis
MISTEGAVEVQPAGSRASVRPKILQVLEATALGTACYMSNLLLNIDTDEFDVSLAYSPIRSDERFRKELKKVARRGIRIYEVYMQRDISPFKDVTSLWALYCLIAKEGFDIVHGHSSKAGFLARLAAKLADPRTATVYSPHAISIAINPKYWYVEKLAGLLTSTVLGVSRSEYDELSNYRLVPPSKLRYVTTGIDIATYLGSFGGGDLRQQLGLSQDTILIGSAGRITAQKDPTTFLRAAAILLQKGVDAHFAWVGYGELEAESEKLAKDLGISERVTFLGYSEDLRPFLEALDVFALTSRFESFGYVTCEAMAMRKPVVATNVAGSNELVIPQVTGYLVNVADPDGVAAALFELATDGGLRRRMGEAGFMRAAEHYDLPRTIRGLEQVYQELFCLRHAARTRPERAPIATLETNN